jgi:hypothetical protein
MMKMEFWGRHYLTLTKEIFFALFISSCVYNVEHRVTLAEYTHDNH